MAAKHDRSEAGRLKDFRRSRRRRYLPGVSFCDGRDGGFERLVKWLRGLVIGVSRFPRAGALIASHPHATQSAPPRETPFQAAIASD